jgi:hypothetical protein
MVRLLEKDVLGIYEEVLKKLLITWGEWHA